MSSVWQDIRLAVRLYVKNPLFTIVVLAVLALAIGVNSAIFSVVNAVVLRPLPYPQASALVAVGQVATGAAEPGPISPPNYFDLRDSARSFAGIAAYWSPSVSLSGAGIEPEKVLAATSSSDLFGVLGVAPAAGRGFVPDDDVPGAARVAILGHGLWQRRFGGDARAIGRELTLDGTPTVIVGVMPRGFEFPAAGTELWVPLRLSRSQPPNPAIRAEAYREYRILNVVARLAQDATVERARAEAAQLASQLERDYPDANRGAGLAVVPLHDTVVGAVRPALLLLAGAVGCVLLVACANVGSLMLVRAARRTREVTIRMALGAGRGRLMRQLITESLVLALAAGTLAIVVCGWTLQVLVRLAPADIPRLDGVRIDGRAIGFTLLIATAAGLLFGLAPAFQVRAHRLHEALLASGRGLVSGGGQRARQLLVVAEIALSLMLLIGAVLLVQSFARLQRVDTGFSGSSVVTVDRIELPRARSSAATSAAFFEGLVDRMRELPGVESAAVTLGLPLDPRARFFVDDSTFSIDGEPPQPIGQRPAAPVHVVGPEYFATVRTPIIRGRAFDDRDRSQAPAVVIINESLARRFWPNQNPIGRRLTHDLAIVPGQPTTREIVGVAGDVRHFGLERAPEPQMFVPHAQMPWPSMAIVIRTPLDAARLTDGVRQAVWQADPTVPVPPLRRMDEALAGAVGQPRFRASLLGAFAATAILLAMTGLYGTIAYAAQQRSREIGLRIALGATPRQATEPLLRQGLALAAAGTVLGLIGSIAVASALRAMLFGVGVNDPATYVAVPLAVAAAAALACYLPARQARRVDPIAAINADR
jgi:putative ABC transport system permease protein